MNGTPETYFTDALFNFTNTSVRPQTSEIARQCFLFDGDTAKCEAVVNVKRVSAGLSIAGSLFTLFLIVLFKKYREPSQRMILHLALGSFCFGISFLIEDIVSEATWKCKFQAVLLSFFIWVCFFWIMCILFNLYFQLLFEFDFRRVEVIVTLVCWILPVVLAVLPFIDDVYAPAGVWCWIENDFKWRFGCWYIWRILFVIVFIVVMVHISYKLHTSRGTRHSSAAAVSCFERDVQTLRIYPIIYFFLNLFPIINRIQNALEGDGVEDQYNFVLLLLQAIADPIFGVTIALSYTLLDSRTRQNLNRRSIFLAWHRWRQNDSQVQEYSGTNPTDHSTEQPTVQKINEPAEVTTVPPLKQESNKQVEQAPEQLSHHPVERLYTSTPTIGERE